MKTEVTIIPSEEYYKLYKDLTYTTVRLDITKSVYVYGLIKQSKLLISLYFSSDSIGTAIQNSLNKKGKKKNV